MRPNSNGPPAAVAPSANKRLNFWYGVLIFIIIVFFARLFYLQIIRHDYYRKAALSDQLKQYTIAPQRGIIEAQSNGAVVPIVLNQTLYTLYVDPSLVKNADENADKLAAITKDDPASYAKMMKLKNTRYVVLAKRLSSAQNDQILKLKIPGVGTQSQDYRTYPQGSLAAQVLGFVNDDGKGAYGIEQTLNQQLSGTPGMLKAITDVNGVPLVASRDNVQVNPKPGSNVVLTVDVTMQKQLESILKQGLDNAHSQSGSAIIMDPNTGAIKAMANWPTYDPSQFYNVDDISVFANPAVDTPLEVGSIMKTLTISAGLNQGVISPTTTYNDSGSVTIDGSTIHDVLIPPNPTSVQNILTLSLNTGAIHVLGLLGGGQINQQARTTWYDYMTNHFQLGHATGIEQTGEADGTIPDPVNGSALDLQYAETSFGQGMSATMLQMASAFSAAINGGTYYKPQLVDSIDSPSGKAQQTKPQVVKSNVVSAKTSSELRDLLENDLNTNHVFYNVNLHSGYVMGGKTGTAQIAEPGGGYLPSTFNGDFVGFVGGDKPQYVIIVLVNKPDIPSYDTGGAKAAAPIFGAIENMLVNVYGVTPQSN